MIAQVASQSEISLKEAEVAHTNLKVELDDIKKVRIALTLTRSRPFSCLLALSSTAAVADRVVDVLLGAGGRRHRRC